MINETDFEFDDDQYNYTIIQNHIFEHNLSAKAIGIYCIISKYRNCKTHFITIKGLMKQLSDGQLSIQNGIRELIEAGFLTRIEKRDEKGRMKGYKYIVHSKPKINAGLEYQEVTPKVDFPNTDNPNTDTSRIINKNIKNKNTKSKIKDDDRCYQSNINQSSPISSKELKAIRDTWQQLTGKRLIVSEANKKKLAQLKEEYKDTEIIETVKQIAKSTWLKNNITLTNFIRYYDRIASGNYDDKEKVVSIDKKSISVSKKVMKQNEGMYHHEDWDFDKLEQLEEEKLRKELGK